jgi:hypothetical protein
VSPEQLDLSGKKTPPEDAGDSGSKAKPGRSERSQRRHRADMKERLYAIFERLAERLEGRGDVELAAMVREDMRAMVGGLDSLARRVPGLSTPILLGLGILEPVLAFGRIARLLLDRWAERRGHIEPEQFEDEKTPDPPSSWPT